MLDSAQFRQWIVRKALKDSGFWAQNIENFLVAIATVESGLKNLVQVGGPALGLYQIELPAYIDTMTYIKSSPQRHQNVLKASGYPVDPDHLFCPTHDSVVYNLKFATLITRMFFARFPEVIPGEKDYQSMYDLYKIRYNGPGKASPERDLPIFKESCL